MYVDKDRPISLRGLSDISQRSERTRALSGIGIATEQIGNPILIQGVERARACTARLMSLALQYDGSPLLDECGNIQYTWIEEERYIDDAGYPAWRDVPLIRGPRCSIMDTNGEYYCLAHEANGGIASSEHVIMWAGVLDNSKVNASGLTDYEHVFYSGSRWYAIAAADWVMGTWRTDTSITYPDSLDYVMVYFNYGYDGDKHLPGLPVLHNLNRYGNVPASGLDPAGPFKAYFRLKNGCFDPAVFEGDVVEITADFDFGNLCVAGSDCYDDQLGMVKNFSIPVSTNPSQEVRQGWAICDGTTPAGSKIGVLPDTRGLYTRATDLTGTPGPYWSDNPGATPATGPTQPAGTFRGVSSSRALEGLAAGGTVSVVGELENAEAWSGPKSAPDNAPGGTINDAVVEPPTFVLQQIIRYK